MMWKHGRFTCKRCYRLVLCAWCVTFIYLIITNYMPKKTVRRYVNMTALTPQILAYLRIQGNKTKDNLINEHLYNLHLNSRACQVEVPFLVLVIHSAPGYVFKRTLIRSTFGSVHQYRDRNITKVFLVGEVENSTLQQQLNEESKIHGDVIQGNFKDSYKTLVKKHIMGMYWYTHYCNANYIVKMDDDTFMNPYRMIDYLIETKPSGLRMWGKLARRFRPFRDSKSKYHTPESQYPFPMFPNFCLGFAYLTTPEAWAVMYKASETTRILNMDDVYVGILAARTEVHPSDLSKSFLRCNGRKDTPWQDINRKVLFFDPLNTCGDFPFKLWKNVTPGVTTTTADLLRTTSNFSPRNSP